MGLKSVSDTAVWDVAKAQGFTILSKDGDFRQRSVLFGAPPKVIGVTIGNCTTALIETIVRSSSDRIRKFHDDATAAFLELP